MKKLRLALILLGLILLALASTVFGMMMAVAQDLPNLENRREFAKAKNSVVYDRYGQKIGTLTGSQNRILVKSNEIPQNTKQAVVSIEDRRFYEHRGVDYQGIARAFVQDVLSRGTTQGGSTITQQFVKNALAAQGDRTLFQKLRESALAYHLERKWDKEKILTQYLNSIYFGEGAYGIEAAARTYFGRQNGCITPEEAGDAESGATTADPTAGTDPAAADGSTASGEPGERCASTLQPHQSALLAGLISSPAHFSPRQNPDEALARRNLVLQKMRDEDVLTEVQYREEVDKSLPAASEIEPPEEDSDAPYFTSWMRQQVVDRYGAGRTFGGGLRVRTTLDLDLQKQAEEIVNSKLAGLGPTASVVALDNRTGGVLAMVGGADFERQPFNLATNGHRQPGSAFKPFTLVRALETGVSPEQAFTSEMKTFDVPGSKKEKFVVHNYEDSYSGVTTLEGATAQSDNSVYAELGLKLGTSKVARTAKKMGIRTKVSTNPAMTLGGLKEGVTPLEMADAFRTLANSGRRVSGTMASEPEGPVAIRRVEEDDGALAEDNRQQKGVNEIRTRRVVDSDVASQATALLEGVVAGGTGKAAAIDGFAAGKTGTTENNGDAWFVGYTRDITVAVWVGYPNSVKPMETLYQGGPVDGGTYPAEIWQEIVTAFQTLQEEREAERDAKRGDETDEGAEDVPAPVEEAPLEPAPEEAPSAPDAPQRAPQPQQPPTPAQPAPDGGQGGAGGGAPPAGGPG